MTSSPEDEPEGNDGYRDWPHDLSALQEIGEEILERWEKQQPNSPRDYPAVRWLNNNGYSHLRWVLQQKHDMGTPEFFVLLTSSGGEKGYKWHIDDVTTIGLVKNYLDENIETRDWEESTKQANRSRINTFLRRFSAKYGDAAVVNYANNPELQTELYETFKEVVIELRNDLSSDESAFQFLRATHRFFEWLLRSNRIMFDPMENIEEEFRWNWDSEPDPLSDHQVRVLWMTAESDEERILVIGYCVWGVRTKELPEVHISQLHLNRDNPVIRFEERQRKNGQGEVSLMFGLDALARLIDKRARRPDWNGYLFPSDDDARAFLSPAQMRSKFKDLCERAGVTIEGDVVTPSNGRSFYYNILADAETDLLEMAAEIAEEQGSKDPSSVRDYYLTPERRRRFRQVLFRRRIREVLPEDAYTSSSNRSEFNSTLDDFK